MGWRETHRRISALPNIRSIEITCISMPVQIYGELIDGRWFYFRSRYGAANLDVADTLDEAIMNGPLSYNDAVALTDVSGGDPDAVLEAYSVDETAAFSTSIDLGGVSASHLSPDATYEVFSGLWSRLTCRDNQRDTEVKWLQGIYDIS